MRLRHEEPPLLLEREQAATAWFLNLSPAVARPPVGRGPFRRRYVTPGFSPSITVSLDASQPSEANADGQRGATRGNRGCARPGGAGVGGGK